MSDTINKIQEAFGQAVISQDGSGLNVIEVAPDQLAPLAKRLKDDWGFDYLITIAGMEWPQGFGALYYLQNTVTLERLCVKSVCASREQPWLPTVSDLWRIGEIYEREAYDFYGIIFVGNQDMRRLYMSIDWKGWPLRKDFPCDGHGTGNDISTESERQTDFTDVYSLDTDGKLQKAQRRIFTDDQFVVNIGPQHPATHGVMRFRTAVDGENIEKIDIYCGYIHRGIEKLCENMTYEQTLHLLDRMDYFAGHNYHHGMCMLIEQAAGIEVPERAQIIRVMMDELARIASHCLFAGTYCMDLGATTMLFYTLRVREMILDIWDKTCGARMSFNYDCIGGVMQDTAPDFEEDVRKVIECLPANIKEYNKLFTGNVITHNRLQGVGVLTRQEAIDMGITGPTGRASGWACDVRKMYPYSIYPQLQFDEITATEGDSMARFKVRLLEMEQSARILEQCLAMLKPGPICGKVPKVLKLPQGTWFNMVEGCRGVFGVSLTSDGATKSYRTKLVPPCLPLAAGIDHVTRGTKIADLITIAGSFDYIVPDIDR